MLEFNFGGDTLVVAINRQGAIRAVIGSMGANAHS
jgi:hypothetical protein